MTQPIRIHGNNRGSWSDFSCGAHADAAEGAWQAESRLRQAVGATLRPVAADTRSCAALGHPHDHHDHLGVPSPFLAPSLPNGVGSLLAG